jgi:3',5'-cyclic AMP phosphodiesterase CpdA
MPYRVLHLSDPHFGEGHQFAQDGAPVGVRRLASAVRYSLDQAHVGLDFDAVVLSGDIFTNVSQDERIKARIELLELRNTFAGSEWILVPGNHDLTWSPDQADDRLVYFNNLVGELWPNLALPRDMPSVTVLPARDGLLPLAFIALDSCRLEGPVQHGLGYFGDDQLDAIPAALQAAQVSPETHTIVAVLHHHLLAVSMLPDLPTTARPEDEERVISSVTLDAARALRALADAGVALVLLGHQHTAKILTLADVDWAARPPLRVAAAGTCGYAGPNILRSFFVWEIDDAQAKATYMQQKVADPYAFEARANEPVMSLI